LKRVNREFNDAEALQCYSITALLCEMAGRPLCHLRLYPFDIQRRMMKSEEISKELGQQEQKKTSLISQMDDLYLEIQGALPAAAAAWMRTEVERRITDHPDAVQSLGIEKLREMKSKLHALIEKVPEMVAAEFQDRSKWPHHRDVKEEHSHSSGKSEPHLDQIFRNVISSLGGILNEFGLLTEPKGYILSWEHKGKDQFRYAINPSMDRIPELKVSEYSKLLGGYTSLSRKIQDTQKSLSEAQAKELWDAA
jgi:hypothetical protein